jgi:hypothetical protein
VKNITVIYWNSSEESVKTGISEDGVILFWGCSGGDEAVSNHPLFGEAMLMFWGRFSNRN